MFKNKIMKNIYINKIIEGKTKGCYFNWGLLSHSYLISPSWCLGCICSCQRTSACWYSFKSSHCMAFLCSTTASMNPVTTLIRRGMRQGISRHLASITITIPIIILNCQPPPHPSQENHPPKKPSVSHPFQVWIGTWAIFLICLAMTITPFPLSSVWRQQSVWLNFPQTPPSSARK